MARTRSCNDPAPKYDKIENSKPKACKNAFKNVKTAELNSQAPFPFGDLIPDAQHHILQFCDVSTLGVLGCCSKTMCEMTREDKVWE